MAAQSAPGLQGCVCCKVVFAAALPLAGWQEASQSAHPVQASSKSCLQSAGVSFRGLGAQARDAARWFKGRDTHMLAGVTRRRHTLVPATAAMVQGKHQPLQWNMGSVHKYRGWCAMSHPTIFDKAFK